MDKEKRMRERFIERARKIMQETPSDPLDVPKMGLEIEMFATEDDGTPALADVFTHLDFVDMELGATQIEVRTDPIELDSIEKLEEEINAKEKMLRTVDKKVVRIGAIPNIPLHKVKVAPKEKYKVVPKFHDKHRGSHIQTEIGGVDFNQANCMSLFSSTQFNIQADSLEDAVDKANRSFMISPFLVAVSGNARIVAGQDTEINDIRMMAWLASHDLRSEEEIKQGKETRIGTPNTYFSSIEDYFSRCSSHPFILDIPGAALEVGIGLFWLDTRIKFIDNKPIVEYRAMSAQPSAKEDVAMAAFYLGRLAYSQKREEPLMDMVTVHANRKSAMKDGLRAILVSDGKEILADTAIENELNKAEYGLLMLGYSDEEIKEHANVIRERLDRWKTPSDIFVEEVEEKGINEALMRYAI